MTIVGALRDGEGLVPRPHARHKSLPCKRSRPTVPTTSVPSAHAPSHRPHPSRKPALLARRVGVALRGRQGEVDLARDEELRVERGERGEALATDADDLTGEARGRVSVDTLSCAAHPPTGRACALELKAGNTHPSR